MGAPGEVSHFFGLSEYALRQKQIKQAIFYKPEKLNSAHLLLCGSSGTGKSFQTLRLLRSMAESGIEMDIYDVHGELSDIPGAVTVKYSQATGYGYNLMELDTDPDTGGVMNQINMIINLVREVTPGFMSKQEAALRYLLQDTYASFGIFQNRPETWKRERITEAIHQDIIENQRWQELRRYYPTLEDLRTFARRKIAQLKTGADNKSVTALERLERTVGRLNLLQRKFKQAQSQDEAAKLEGQIGKIKDDCISNYTEYIESMQTGRELDDVLKYDSVEVLTSVIQRIDILSSAGIFRANPPPFGDARVRVHNIKSLQDAQQYLFTKISLRRAFDESKRAGKTDSGTELRRLAFLDEAPKYFTEERDDIINIIAREARKFGLGLWCAAQEPTSFPESFMTNVGCTILLGIHSKFWKKAAGMLGITEDTLKWIRPKQVISVRMESEGVANPPFTNIVVPNPKWDLGQMALEYESQLT